MKTVFYINCTDIGSTGKIIEDTAAVAAKHGYRCALCAPNITKPETDYLKKYRVSNRFSRAVAYRLAKITGNYYGIGSVTAASVIRKIQKEKADLVHVHCANGSFINLYKLFRWLKKNRTPTVVTNHAEFFYTGNCDHAYDCDRWMSGCGQCPRKLSKVDSSAKYWEKMRIAFCDFSNLIVTSVSPWVMARSTASPIMEGTEQRLVMNGVNTDIFRIYNEKDIWQRYGVAPNGKRVVLYVTACFYGDSEEKGSKYLLQLAEMMAAENVVFVVVGSYVPGVTVPSNVHLVGRITDQTELAKLYSAADLTLITSRRETFSMPVAESLCCGTPVVGFKAGGPESIAIEEYCRFAEQGNVQELWEMVNEQINKTIDTNVLEKLAKGKYASVVMANKYLNLYNELLADRGV